MKRQKLLKKAFALITSFACVLTSVHISAMADEGDPIPPVDVNVYYVNDYGEEEMISTDVYCPQDSVTVCLSDVISYLENSGREYGVFSEWHIYEMLTGAEIYIEDPYTDTLEFTMPEDSVNVHCQFTFKKVTVNYNANGGTGAMEPQSVTVRSNTDTLSANTFVRPDYMFTGWNTMADGSGDSFDDCYEIDGKGPFSNYDDEITLYAQWELFPYEYVPDSTGTYAILTSYIGSDTEIQVPSSIDGYPVKEMNSTFAGNTSITKVTIPEGVTKMSNAFTGCTSLRKVILPSTMGSTDSSFRGLDRLSSAGPVGSGCSIEYAWTDEIPAGAFLNAGIISIRIPSGITRIGGNAFSGARNLNYVHYEGNRSDWMNINILSGNSVLADPGIYYRDEETKYVYTYNGEYVTLEQYFGNDTEINVPVTVDGLSVKAVGSAYIENESITIANVPEGIVTLEGSFATCLNLTEVSLPKSLRTIGEETFANTSIQDITIPEGVKTIGTSAFRNNTALSVMDLPSTLTTIKTDAFYGCTGLSDTSVEYNVHYMGTQDDWFNVNVAEGNDCLINAVFKFTDKLETSEDELFEYAAIDDYKIMITGYTPREDQPYPNILRIPEKIHGLTVISINSNAFANHDEIIEVVLPSTMETIGTRAFFECSNLEEINLPEGLKSIGRTAFYGCNSLDIDSFPSTLETLEYGAFQRCTSLTVSRIPDSVTSLGWYVFEGCTSITEITVGSGIKNLTKSLFYDCNSLETINLPDTLETICGESLDSAALSGTALKELVIPESVTKIGSSTFYLDRQLEKVVIPGGVTETGRNMFYGCTSLKTAGPTGTGSYNIEYGWEEEIPSYGFGSNANLTILTVPAGMRTIRSNASNGCTGITDVFYMGTEEEWQQVEIEETGNEPILNATMHFQESYSFAEDEFFEYVILKDHAIAFSYKGISADDVIIPEYVLISDGNRIPVTAVGGSLFEANADICSVEFPSTIETIGSRAFYQCENLTSIQLNRGLKKIGSFAFNDCINLNIANLPETLEDIGEYAFYNTNISITKIPDSVTNIDSYAFGECESITSMEIGSGLESLGDSIFIRCSNLSQIILPETLKEIGIFNGTVFADTALEEVIITEGIETIRIGSFGWCYNLKKVVLPESLSHVENYIFGYSPNLRTVGPNGSGNFNIEYNWKESIPENAFRQDTSISIVTIPTSITSIGLNAFEGDNEITDVFYLGTQEEWNIIDIEDGNDPILNAKMHYGESYEIVDENEFEFLVINNYAYVYAYIGEYIDEVLVIPDSITLTKETENEEGGSELTEIIVPVIGICGNVFTNREDIIRVQLPSTMETIGTRAFFECSNLEEINLPEGLKSIGRTAFYGCNSLDIDSFPSTLETLEYGAFQRCTSLTVSRIPDSVTSLGWYVFEGCTSITEMTIGSGIKNLAKSLFYDCSSLETINLPDTLETICGESLDSAALSGTALKELVIPESVTKIGSSTFYLDRQLEKVVIPGGVTETGRNMFYGCTSLKTAGPTGTGSYNIEYGWEEEIPSYGFGSNANLTILTVPAGMRTIRSNASNGCTGITDVFYMGTEEEWQQVEIEDGNDPIINATMHYIEDPLIMEGSTLVLNGTIAINFYVQVPEYRLEDIHATASVNGRIVEIPGKNSKFKGTNLYAFKVPVAAKECRDTIVIKFEDSEGNPIEMRTSEGRDITGGYEYSVYQYTSDGSRTGLLKSLCNAIDNYSGYAQVYFKHNEGNATLTDVSNVTPDKVETYKARKEGEIPEGIAYKGASLILESETTVRQYFQPEEGHSIEEYEFIVNGSEVIPEYNPVNGLWYVDVDNVAAENLSQETGITVRKGEEEATIYYSPYSYIRGKLKNSTDNDLQNLCKALYNYGQAAQAYFADNATE